MLAILPGGLYIIWAFEREAGRWGTGLTERIFRFVAASGVFNLFSRLEGSNDCIGGLFGAESYAAGYPEEPQDLFLERAYQMTGDGHFAYDRDGHFVELGFGLLVRWDEIRIP